jgi:hypothetical protein
MVHFILSNLTSHPASVKTWMPKREAMESSGMMCPIHVTGSPIMFTSHIWVEVTCLPLARDTCRGQVVCPLLTMGVPSITKIWVALEYAIASFLVNLNAAPANAGVPCVVRGGNNDVDEDVLDAMTVLSSLSGGVECAE